MLHSSVLHFYSQIQCASLFRTPADWSRTTKLVVKWHGDGRMAEAPDSAGCGFTRGHVGTFKYERPVCGESTWPALSHYSGGHSTKLLPSCHGLRSPATGHRW
jgi:hypothetical protein